MKKPARVLFSGHKRRSTGVTFVHLSENDRFRWVNAAGETPGPLYRKLGPGWVRREATGERLLVGRRKHDPVLLL